MTLLIGLLTFVLVLNCLFLILLVLIQLPKKEAGAGIAFGGGATDALFGAGSGNALTNLTKYAATLFLGLALVLTFLNTRRTHASRSRIEQELQKRSGSAAVAPIVAPAAATAPSLATSTGSMVNLQPSMTTAASNNLQPSMTASTKAITTNATPVISKPAANTVATNAASKK